MAFTFAGQDWREQSTAKPTANQGDNDDAGRREDHRTENEFGIAQLNAEHDNTGAQADAQPLLESVDRGGAREGCPQERDQCGDFHPHVPQDPGVFSDIFQFGRDLAPVNGTPHHHCFDGLIAALLVFAFFLSATPVFS